LTADVTLLSPALTVPTRNTRAVVLTVVRVAIAVAIAGSIAYAAVRLWPDVRDTFANLDVWTLLASFAVALTAIAANVKAWQAVLTELGHEVPAVVAGRIYLVGQLGKYLPGSVWAFVLQVELSLRAGIPRARSFAGSLILVGLSTTAALVLGLLGLPVLVEVGGAAVWAVAVLAPVAVVCAVPPVLTRLVDTLLRILRKPGLDHRLRTTGLLRVTGWMALGWTLFGLHFWLLGVGVSGNQLPSLIDTVGAFALAMTAGMLAIASPSGLGIREAVLVASLAPFVGVGTALGVALASRLVLTVADVLAAGAATWSASRLRDRADATPAIVAR
jgi:glycosyltransferase 2 family protein